MDQVDFCLTALAYLLQHLILRGLQIDHLVPHELRALEQKFLIKLLSFQGWFLTILERLGELSELPQGRLTFSDCKDILLMRSGVSFLGVVVLLDWVLLRLFLDCLEDSDFFLGFVFSGGFGTFFRFSLPWVWFLLRLIFP